MGDPEIRTVIRERDPASIVVEMPVPNGKLPLAAARNAGAVAAIHAGAELLIFLDVDCVPAETCLARYESAAQLPPCGSGILSGPVAYLPAAATGTDPTTWSDVATPHPARPVPAPDEVLLGDDPNLFWSLSFAATTQTWRRVGGFCEDYVGYGGEDTDYMRLALRAGAALWWVGGANAFHQHHESPRPPTAHLDDILRNADIFYRRWGTWPMLGWLEQFQELGLVTRNAATGHWEKVLNAGRANLDHPGSMCPGLPPAMAGGRETRAQDA
jgi:GT2 family glycosyltransferase